LLRRLTSPGLPGQTVRIPASIEHRDSCGCERARASVPRDRRHASVRPEAAQVGRPEASAVG
jgi:hypothetical protein